MTKERIIELYRLVYARDPPNDYNPTAREIAWLYDEAEKEQSLRDRDHYAGTEKF